MSTAKEPSAESATSEPTALELPRPRERPNSSVVVYDGHCEFCRRQVRRFHRWDGQQLLAFISLHDPEVGHRWPNLSKQRLLQEMCLITPDGQQLFGAAAIRQLSRQLKPLWWLAPLLHLPGSLPLWRRLYAFVAARRYKLVGGKTACGDDACSIK